MKSMLKMSGWSSQSFFVGKQKEQHNRHLNYMTFQFFDFERHLINIIPEMHRVH
jgi:hypothetical protein